MSVTLVPEPPAAGNVLLCVPCHRIATGWTPLGRGHFDAVHVECSRCGQVALCSSCDCAAEQPVQVQAAS